MITVFDIVTTPMFKDFRIFSGKRGLQNPVSGTGLLDWESGEAITRSFNRGDFVLTTLVADRGNPAGADQCVVSLMRSGVSAVCIKDVFFSELSEETRRLSEQLAIPVFFFSDTFIDDIVFEIRSLLKEDIGSLRDRLGSLLSGALAAWYEDGAMPVAAASTINAMLGPYLHGHFLCGAVFSTDGAPLGPVLPSPKGSGQEAFLAVPFRRGLLLFLSSPRGEDLTPGLLSARWAELRGGSQPDCLGTSRRMQGPDGIAPAILEAIVSCGAGLLRDAAAPENGEARGRSFAELLAADFYTPASKAFFLERYRALLTYDREHGSELLATLAAYIQADGDLNLASRRVFQHANTIRYRIGKIKTLLGLEGPGSYTELYLFGKMCRLQWFYGDVMGISPGAL